MSIQKTRFSINSFSTGEHREPCYNTKEVAVMFGYSSPGMLRNDVQRGKFPEATLKTGMLGAKCYWSKSVLNEELKRRGINKTL
jgi:hypothetical protein